MRGSTCTPICHQKVRGFGRKKERKPIERAFAGILRFSGLSFFLIALPARKEAKPDEELAKRLKERKSLNFDGMGPILIEHFFAYLNIALSPPMIGFPRRERGLDMALKIVLDSSIGYTKEEVLQKGYYFIPLLITLGDVTYTEGVDITPDQFYALLAQGLMPHTAQPSPELYKVAFNDASKDGDEVILLSLSSKISGAYQAANIAKNECDHPEKIHILDTLSFFCGSQILLHEVEEHQDLPINDLMDYLEDLKTRIHVFAGMDSLTYVYKGGRLSKFHYALGIFLHAKPIGTLDEGSVVLAGKAMGTKNAMSFVVDKAKEFPIDFTYPAYLFYSSDRNILERFEQDFFFPAFPEAKTWPTAQINPLIGSHIGPMVYGLFYVSKPQESSPKPSFFQKIHQDIHSVFHKKD